MTTLAYILCTLFFIIGVILGVSLVKSPKEVGIFHVNKDDASKDLFSIEFTSDAFLESEDGDYIAFRVENKSFNETK